jgi:hypothetical protein
LALGLLAALGAVSGDLSGFASHQATETWTLVGKDIPILPESIVSSNDRGYQSFIKLIRIKEREVAYVHVDQRYGVHWISVFEWDEPAPNMLSTRQQALVALRSRVDRRQGNGGLVGRISVTAERGYDAHVTEQSNGLASPLTQPAGTGRFTVTERRDLPNVNEFRLSVYINDGGVTNLRVATYTYKKTGSASATPPAGTACGYQLNPSMHRKWLGTGGERGILGCPTMNEAAAGRSPQGTEGLYALFQFGTICTHRSGAYAGQSFETHGDINVLYNRMSGTNSWLGFPVSDEFDAPGGRRSRFEGGYIHWDAASRQARAFRY